jgi:hypothetical protein
MLLRDALRYLRHDRFDFGGHRAADRQRPLVGVPVILVEVHHLHLLHVQAGAAHHVRLRRDFRDSGSPSPRCSTLLDERPAVAVALEHVHGAKHASCSKQASKITSWPVAMAVCVRAMRAGCDSRPRSEGRSAIPSGLARQRACPVEEALENDVGLEFFGVGLVDRPPEQLGSLPAGRNGISIGVSTWRSWDDHTAWV